MDKVRFLAEGNPFVFLIQHGYHYVSWKPAIKKSKNLGSTPRLYHTSCDDALPKTDDICWSYFNAACLSLIPGGTPI